jgi:hypothetical protein
MPLRDAYSGCVARARSLPVRREYLALNRNSSLGRTFYEFDLNTT